MAIFCLLVFSTASCSHYTPTLERYEEEVTELLHAHEDEVLVRYGLPTEIIELSEGRKVLVYDRIPYRVAPALKTAGAYCRTAFRIDDWSRVGFIRADGNYCVR